VVQYLSFFVGFTTGASLASPLKSIHLLDIFYFVTLCAPTQKEKELKSGKELKRKSLSTYTYTAYNI